MADSRQSFVIERNPEPVGVADRAARERATKDPQQRERGEGVNQQVDQMITFHAQAADRMIEREAEVEHRSTTDGFSGRGRRSEPSERREGSDCGVFDDGRQIIEDKRAAQAVAPGEQDHTDHNHGGVARSDHGQT